MNRKLGCVVDKNVVIPNTRYNRANSVFARFNKLLQLLLAKYEENLIKTFAQLCV